MRQAIYYLFLFIAIQFATYYPTLILWNCIGGMDLATAASLTMTQKILVSTPQVITTQIIFSIVMTIVFLWRKYSTLSPAWIRTRQWSVILWCIVLGLGTIIPSQALQELLPPLSDILKQTMMGVMSTAWGYIAICIMAPFVEELVFRGAIERTLLTKTKPIWAITISALMFALVHANPAQMPHAFIIGLILGWIYWRTGSILPGIALHWVNNTAAYAVYRIAPEWADASLIDIFGTNQKVIMAIGFSLMIMIPALLQLNLNMKKSNEKFGNQK